MEYTVIALFFLLQFINVMLNTAKTLIMARTDNPHMSALINAVTFGFYTAVVKQIATLDLGMTIAVVVVTNVIGVYATYAIVNRLKKDNLWKIEIYIGTNLRLREALEATGVPMTKTAPQMVTMYAYTQSDSERIKCALHNNSCKKYNITEITKKF